MPEYVKRAKSPFVQGTEPAGILLIDHILAEFLAEGLDTEKIDVKIGFPKAGWKVPSVYVSCPSYQLQPFLGYRGRRDPTPPADKLTRTKIYNNDGTVAKVRTNITDHDEVTTERTFLSIATTKISCYARNWDEMHLLAKDITSFVLMNFQFYLRSLNYYNDDVSKHLDPLIRGLNFQNMHTDYTKTLAGVSNVYETSIIMTIPYLVRITDQYTWITDIHVTENIKEFTTDTLIQQNERDI